MDKAQNQPRRVYDRLYSVLIPETKRGIASVGDWASLGTLAGSVRRENQDRLFGGQFASIDGQAFRIVALSDGMGGLRHGQEAAATTLAALLWYLTNNTAQMPERLLQATYYANEEVVHKFGNDSGATLSAVVITADDDVLVVNVGDSRAYGFSKESGLIQISSDDTLAGLAVQGVAVDVRHNSNALLQYMGMGEGLDPHVYFNSELRMFDFLVLTSDGIHWVGKRMLELIARNASDHNQLTRRLLNLAEMTGAHDNASIGAVELAAAPTPAVEPQGDFVEVEVWTPHARTVLMAERRREPITHIDGSASPSTDARLPARAYRYPEEAPAKSGRQKPAKKTRKRTKPQGKPAEQASLPIDRPELKLEIDRKNND